MRFLLSRHLENYTIVKQLYYKFEVIQGFKKQFISERYYIINHIYFDNQPIIKLMKKTVDPMTKLLRLTLFAR